MKKLLLSVGVASALTLSFAACDLEKTSNQLQANKVMVATILSTPPVTISPAAMVGFDANFFGQLDGGFDGGFDAGGFDAGAFDAGGVTFGPNGVTVPGQTAAFVFFGQRKTQSLDTPPEGLAGAVVTVTPSGGAVTTLKEEGPTGSHQKTSQDDANFKYVSGADYSFSASFQGDKFTGKVEKAPALEAISEFHPPKGYIELTAGTSFTFTRPEPPANESRNLGFVQVFPIKENGEKGEPTYTNIPKEPLDFLKLVAAPAEWRGSPVIIPGTAFPQKDKNYIIVFQAVKNGGPETDNLFTGSALLAGTAEIGVVKTK